MPPNVVCVPARMQGVALCRGGPALSGAVGAWCVGAKSGDQAGRWPSACGGWLWGCRPGVGWVLLVVAANRVVFINRVEHAVQANQHIGETIGVILGVAVADPFRQVAGGGQQRELGVTRGQPAAEESGEPEVVLEVTEHRLDGVLAFGVGLTVGWIGQFADHLLAACGLGVSRRCGAVVGVGIGGGQLRIQLVAGHGRDQQVRLGAVLDVVVAVIAVVSRHRADPGW